MFSLRREPGLLELFQKANKDIENALRNGKQYGDWVRNEVYPESVNTIVNKLRSITDPEELRNAVNISQNMKNKHFFLSLALQTATCWTSNYATDLLVPFAKHRNPVCVKVELQLLHAGARPYDAMTYQYFDSWLKYTLEYAIEMLYFKELDGLDKLYYEDNSPLVKFEPRGDETGEGKTCYFDLNQKPERAICGGTYLHETVMRGQADGHAIDNVAQTLLFLLDHGADPKITSNFGWTLLHHLARLEDNELPHTLSILEGHKEKLFLCWGVRDEHDKQTPYELAVGPRRQTTRDALNELRDSQTLTNGEDDNKIDNMARLE
jgi:hypothetical protein